MSERMMLVVGGVTMHGTAADLRRLLAAVRAAGGKHWVLLCQQLAEGLQEHDSKEQGAAGDDGGVHAPNMLRANGAGKSAR